MAPSESMEEQQQQQVGKGVKVVVMPLPAQGHLNQLLHFSLLLSSGDPHLSVHYVSSTTHSRQARDRLHGWDPAAIASIHFHDFSLPPYSSPPPDPNSSTKFPSHILPALEASYDLREPVAALLRSLSAASRRLVLILEPFMSFAGRDASSLPNVEIYSFQCVPASFQLPLHFDAKNHHPPLKKEVLDIILPSFDGSVTGDFRDLIGRRVDRTLDVAGYIINTCRAIEGEFIGLLANQPVFRGRKLYAVGPLNPVVIKNGVGGWRHECLEWLDKQPQNSVVFVSFGTTTALPDEQIEQLAIGLKSSGQRFIWVLRDADRGDIFIDDGGKKDRRLPEGYEKEVEGVGMVIRGWAPQLEILAHPATGAFMSHCGWNSCMEGMSMGVPILAWPMHSDQPRNGVLVTKYLKVGVMVREWEQRDETVVAAAVEAAVRRVMVGEKGEEIRRRAVGLGEDVRRAMGVDGLSQAELSDFIAQISR